MNVVEQLVQGTPAWHAHRARHFNASDAPAMMGCSPYETRAALLRRLHTGIANEHDAGTQRLFANGHRFEALARPVAERIIDEPLDAITVTNGRLSASLDGATLDGQILFEHKTLTAELRTLLAPGGNTPGSALPLHYRVQMEQQLHCAGGDRCLFMASKWSDDDEMVEERHCWYTGDITLRTQIIHGWQQFEADLFGYVPAEVMERATAAPQDHLPAVSVQLSGALAVVSNLAPFGVALREFIAKIPARPSTDQEFADTEAACKRLKEAEERLQAAEDSALASMADVNEMRRLVGEFRELARGTRLASEKLVKARKEQIREEEVQRGSKALAEHVIALCERIGGPYIPPIPFGFAGAIKGLKSLDSVRNAIDTELARCKIEASALADKIDANLKAIAAANAPHLFADKAVLVLKAPDDLAAIITTRVLAEAERLENEVAARGRARASAALPAATLGTAETPAPDKREAAPNTEQPTLTLGTICDRIGLTVTADLLARLGYPHTQVRASKCYRDADFAPICLALAAHLVRAAG
jgi:putative phage-type endonuclease